MAIEYDGRWHATAKQAALDRERRSRIEAEGWRFVIVTADELATDYEAILNAVVTATRAQLAR